MRCLTVLLVLINHRALRLGQLHSRCKWDADRAQITKSIVFKHIQDVLALVECQQTLGMVPLDVNTHQEGDRAELSNFEVFLEL